MAEAASTTTTAPVELPEGFTFGFGEAAEVLETVAPTAGTTRPEPMSTAQALDVARQLAPHIVMPSDCQRLPLDTPVFMPNAPRAYRSGTHQGVDFACPRGHPVVAALDGRVLVAVGDFEDPSLRSHNDVLAIAESLDATPPYTLVMLYGNYVVVDHGIIDSVGHVVSIYAHLDALDPAVRIARQVSAGVPLGRIGNTGTTSAARGRTDENVHLHWELHVNGQYLGAGLSESDTRSVYAALFAAAG